MSLRTGPDWIIDINLYIYIYIDYMINQIMKTQTQFIDHWSITSTVYTQVYVVGLYCLYTLYVYQLALTQEPDSNSSEESMSTVKKVWMDWWGLCFIWDRKNPDMKREMFCVSIYIIYMQCVGSLTLSWTNNIYMYIYNIFYVQEVLDLRKSRLLQYLNMQYLSNRANYIYNIYI